MKRKTSYWAIPEKKTKQGAWGYTFVSPPPPSSRNFYICHCILKNSTAFTPGNSVKFCNTLWKFQGQKPRPMEIPHNFFLNSPGNSTPFLIHPWSFHVFSLIPLEISCSETPVWIFSEIVHCCSCMSAFFKLWFWVYIIYAICQELVLLSKLTLQG